VILSGYPSRLYDETLAGWRSKEFQAMTRGGVRTEKIWMNYPEGCAYSHTLAGKDSNDRHRHRIKRKVERWRAKYSALPLLKGWRSWWRLTRLTQSNIFYRCLLYIYVVHLKRTSKEVICELIPHLRPGKILPR
jgi:hypothetical protein